MKVADAQDLDPQETREWLDALSAVRGHRGNERAEFVVNAVIDAARRGGLQIEQSLTTPYCNTIPVGPAAGASGRSRDRAQDPLDHPLERARDRSARQQGQLRARRPHRELPVGCHALRHRLQPFLACADGHAWRRPDLRPGPLLARHLCARLPRGTAERGATARLPAGGRRQGAVVAIRTPG